jgi:hypothetical protein
VKGKEIENFDPKIPTIQNGFNLEKPGAKHDLIIVYLPYLKRIALIRTTFYTL